MSQGQVSRFFGFPSKDRACNRCKDKKIKCDKARPFCQRCQAAGQLCVYLVAIPAIEGAAPWVDAIVTANKIPARDVPAIPSTSSQQGQGTSAEGGNNQSEVTERPIKEPACVRCREKRVKCDREKPACRRCVNHSTACVYPVPFVWVSDVSGLGTLEGDQVSPNSGRTPYTTHSDSSVPSVSATPANVRNQYYVGSHPISTSEIPRNHPNSDVVDYNISMTQANLAIKSEGGNNNNDIYNLLVRPFTKLMSRRPPPTIITDEEGQEQMRHDSLARHTTKQILHWFTVLQSVDLSVNETDPTTIPGPSSTETTLAQKVAFQALTDQCLFYYFHCFPQKTPLMHKKAFMDQTNSLPQSPDSLPNPLMIFSICALASRHACQFHQFAPFNTLEKSLAVGSYYYTRARSVLEDLLYGKDDDDEFDDPIDGLMGGYGAGRKEKKSPETVFGLVHMAEYLEMVVEESQAQILHSLAVRVAIEAGFNNPDCTIPAVSSSLPSRRNAAPEPISWTPTEKEINKRLWWYLWLRDQASARRNLTTSIPNEFQKNSLDMPTPLEDEEEEVQHTVACWREEIKLLGLQVKIKDFVAKYKETSGKPGSNARLNVQVNTIAGLEKSLVEVYNGLPLFLKLDSGFIYSDERAFLACLIVNLEYQALWIELHKFFLPDPNLPDQNVPLTEQQKLFRARSEQICGKAAFMVTLLLESCWKTGFCYTDYIELSRACDVHLYLFNSLNPEARSRARDGVPLALSIVNQHSECLPAKHHIIKEFEIAVKARLPSDTPNESSSNLDPSASSSSSAPIPPHGLPTPSYGYYSPLTKPLDEYTNTERRKRQKIDPGVADISHSASVPLQLGGTVEPIETSYLDLAHGIPYKRPAPQDAYLSPFSIGSNESPSSNVFGYSSPEETFNNNNLLELELPNVRGWDEWELEQFIRSEYMREGNTALVHLDGFDLC